MREKIRVNGQWITQVFCVAYWDKSLSREILNSFDMQGKRIYTLEKANIALKQFEEQYPFHEYYLVEKYLLNNGKYANLQVSSGVFTDNEDGIKFPWFSYRLA